MRRVGLCFALCVMGALAAAVGGCNGASDIARNRLGHDGNKGFLVKTVHRGIWTRKYGLFVPLTYRPGTGQKYPVIVFLHGIGEGAGLGEGDLKNMTVGLGPAVARKADQFQFIVIFPQSGGSWDPNSEYVSDMFAALDQVCKDYPVDQDRIYLTGLSTGGHGTWAIGSKYHDRFAALVPMGSNGADTRDADNLTHIAVRAYCSVAGDIFAGWNDQSMVHRIKELNPSANAQFIATPTFGHDCWENVYSGDELYAWLMQQHRTSAATALQTAPPPPAPTVAVMDSLRPVGKPPTVAAAPAAAPAPKPAVPSAARPTPPAQPRTPLISPPAPRPISAAPSAPAAAPREDGAWVNTSW
jgi:pimeloyl-ACP methyl ester carboxylesterase